MPHCANCGQHMSYIAKVFSSYCFTCSDPRNQYAQNTYMYQPHDYDSTPGQEPSSGQSAGYAKPNYAQSNGTSANAAPSYQSSSTSTNNGSHYRSRDHFSEHVNNQAIKRFDEGRPGPYAWDPIFEA